MYCYKQICVKYLEVNHTSIIKQKIRVVSLSKYVYLFVDNIMTNFRAIMVYVFHFGLIIYRKVNSV